MTGATEEWYTLMRDAHRTGCTAEVLTPPLELAWKYEKGGYFWACPAIVGDRVYLASDRMYALDIAAGTLVWRSDEIKAVGGPVGCTFSNSKLFACGLNETVAINAQTGEIEFTVPMDNGGFSTPCVSEGVVCWSSRKGRFFAADASSGIVKWSRDTDLVAHSSPAADRGTVYFTNERYVYALDVMTGELKWEWCFEPKDVPKFVPMHPAAVCEDKLLVSIRDAGLFALDLENGSVQWRYQTKHGPFTAPSVEGGVAYVASRQLHAVDVNSGQEIWTSTHRGGLMTSAPIISGNTIYIGGGAHRAIYAFDRRSGEKIWQYEMGDEVYVTGAIASGRLLIGCHDGFLYCFKEA